MSQKLQPQIETIVDTAESLLRDGFEAAGAREYREGAVTIAENGRGVLQLVDTLLDLTLMQSGQREPADDTFDLAELVSACVDSVADEARQKGVVVQVARTAAAPTLVADRRMTRQMLLHLLGNAVKFTPADGTVSVNCAIGKDGGLWLSVTDTGIGIAPENLPKVVEPFCQIGTVMTRSHNGAGLGLALVSEMAHAHGGALTLESKIGIGTTATLRFPPDRTAAKPESETAGASAAAA
jgi:signal transduction histidine kinase